MARNKGHGAVHYINLIFTFWVDQYLTSFRWLVVGHSYDPSETKQTKDDAKHEISVHQTNSLNASV